MDAPPVHVQTIVPPAGATTARYFRDLPIARIRQRGIPTPSARMSTVSGVASFGGCVAVVTVTVAVLSPAWPPQVAVRVFSPASAHWVVNVGPVPAAGVPPGALHSTPARPVPFAVNSLGSPMERVTAAGLMPVSLHEPAVLSGCKDQLTFAIAVLLLNCICLFPCKTKPECGRASSSTCGKKTSRCPVETLDDSDGMPDTGSCEKSQLVVLTSKVSPVALTE